MTELSITWWTFARLLVLALVLVTVVRSLRIALRLAPMGAVRRRNLQQAFPFVELLVGALYLVAMVQELFRGQPELVALAVLGIVFGGLWLGRFALMDVLTGVVLRTGGSVALGDRVQLDGLQGRVAWLGYRVLALETRRGDEALIPYSRLARQSVVRTPHVDGAYRHTFRTESFDDGTAGQTAERLRQLALLCHWSSVARAPAVEHLDDGGYEVTVFALEADRGPEIEAFVRKQL